MSDTLPTSAERFGLITKTLEPRHGITPNMADYEAACRDFSWLQMEQSLNLPRQNGFNKATICIDDHPPDVMQRPALVWESTTGKKEVYTFEAMKRASNQAANFFQGQNIRPQDRVFIFLERIPELYFILFGALKNRAIVGPLFSAFGPDALRDRIQDCGARFIVTSPALKSRIDDILADCPSIEKVIIVDRPQTYSTYQPNEVNYLETIATLLKTFDVPYTDADDYSIIHYTSGTTGKPKGAVHRHGAIVSQAATSRYVLDLHPESDVYWCTADPGWVTGTSYGMFGPWALGVTSVVYEGPFKPQKWYQVLQDYRVTVWYTAPTAIRMLMKAGDDLPRAYDLSHLRHLLSVGEPLNPEAVTWGQNVLGHVFHDTWWQTETGCIHISNYPCLQVKPGSMGKPHPGVKAAVLDEAYNPLPAGSEGHLALRPQAPSIFRTYWQKEDLYESKFRNGWYLTGDKASVDEDGYFWFFGRADDVINTAGHLVGPFEVESALIEHPAVAEAGVIGVPDEERMEVVKAYISLKAGYTASEALKAEVQQFVRTRLAAHAYPRELEFIDSLPKTRSGKIMRRLLKARSLGLPEGDISTLED